MRRRLRRLLPGIVIGIGVAFPLGALAGHQFGDVANSNPYHADIDAIADAGVTTGCGGGNYCPSAYVTREQMAAFMNRLGALGAGKTPVVNAAKVDGHDEILPAEDIVIRQLGPWSTVGGGLAEQVLSGTSISAVPPTTIGAILNLQAPGEFGGVTYGLSSVEICYGDSNGISVLTTQAGYSTTTNADLVINDGTEHALDDAGCYTVTDPAPSAPGGGGGIVLTLEFDPGGVAFLSNTTVTWTPVP